jgi:hypothetical protein
VNPSKLVRPVDRAQAASKRGHHRGRKDATHEGQRKDEKWAIIGEHDVGDPIIIEAKREACPGDVSKGFPECPELYDEPPSTGRKPREFKPMESLELAVGVWQGTLQKHGVSPSFSQAEGGNEFESALGGNWWAVHRQLLNRKRKQQTAA